MSSSLTLAEQINLAGVYIESAAWHARLCKELEDEGVNNYLWHEIPESLHNKHEYTAISCFSASVQFLEAEFNKVLEDDLDLLTNSFKSALQDQTVKKAFDLIIKTAKVGFEKGSQPHEKFNAYLQAGGFSPLDKDTPPYAM